VIRILDEGWLPDPTPHPAVIRRIRESLSGDLPSEGIPDLLAPVALGDDAPTSLLFETVEELRALFDGEMSLVTPGINVESSGQLIARGADRFKINASLGEGNERRGPFWWDEDGALQVMPLDLAQALDSIEEGPPERLPRQSDSEWSRSRLLWWGKIKKSLRDHGAQLDGYLERLDIAVVDKLKPVVDQAAEIPDVHFTADDVEDKGAFNKALEGYSPRSGREPTARWVDAAGARRTQRLALTDRGKRAAARASVVLRNRKRFEPYLRDAPETIFDPEHFDLSDYSERVVGVRGTVYRVSKAQVLGTDGRKKTRITLTSPGGARPPRLSNKETSELAAKLVEAARKGQDYVRHRGLWVRVPSQSLANAFERQARSERGVKGELVPALNIEEENYASEDSGRAMKVAVAQRPPGLSDAFELMAHQLEGWEWLAGHAGLVEGALDHGLLADDMGLGKTLQVLSLMAVLEERKNLRPSIVVAPLSLLENWEQEARKFFPSCFQRIARLPLPGMKSSAALLEQFDLVFVSYDTLRTRQLELGRVRWKLMVLDESHRIRNPTARTTHAVLCMDADARIALTGTPVQNSLVDLWSQFDWLCPGFLGDLKRFKKEVKTDDAQALDDLRNQIAPRMLRRMKEGISNQLPPKSGDREAITISMAGWQAELYDAVLRDRSPGRGSTLGTLSRLFTVCNDPGALSDDVPSSHPKLDWLLSTLDSIEGKGEKALVFADRYAVQARIMELVEERFGVRVDCVNGRVQAGHRLRLVDRFNKASGFQVLVLGPRAAGVGLNVTGANHVIHFTRHWNPAIESQATDRAYRIGQTLPVRVYLPTMVHPSRPSIEESLHRLLAEKRALAADVVVPTSELDVGRELERVVLGGSE